MSTIRGQIPVYLTSCFFLLCWPAMYSYALCTAICK